MNEQEQTIEKIRQLGEMILSIQLSWGGRCSVGEHEGERVEDLKKRADLLREELFKQGETLYCKRRACQLSSEYQHPNSGREPRCTLTEESLVAPIQHEGNYFKIGPCIRHDIFKHVSEWSKEEAR